MLPTIIASSVIRATNRGDSHGGIYKVNLETGETLKMLDWNNPNINWDGRGGDRGIRGLAFFGDLLYAVAGNELFAFNKQDNKLKLLYSFQNKFLVDTHESWRHKERLYICAGGTNSILIFDLVAKRWITSVCHDDNSMGAKTFDPYTGVGHENINEQPYMHLDSVYANDDYLWYCGAFTRGLWRLNLNTGETNMIQLQIPDTHNARPYKGGYIYNLSRFSKTVVEYGGNIIKTFMTPKYSKNEMENTHLNDRVAVQGYTRGMVIYDKYVITGTSPAAINVFDITLKQTKPIKTVRLSKDIRNSICGMALYEWE